MKRAMWLVLLLAPVSVQGQVIAAASPVPAASVVAATGAADSTKAAEAALLPTLTIRGFIAASSFFQTAAFGFGNGQSALWVRAHDAGADTELLGADVRNSRLTLDVRGAELGAAVRGGGVLELDFFGGYVGASGASDEQPLPRLRLAYADLSRGGTTVRIGQFWAPVTGYVPVSATHIAYPLGLGSAGLIGWRNPGIGVLHGAALTHALRATVQLALLRGSWSGPGEVLEQQSAGETSRVPQLEARIDLARGERWSWYAAAHYDHKDLSGYGPDTAGLGTLDGTALTTGAKLRVGALTVHGNGYTGRAVGQHLGALAQYGDIRSHGGWVQAGWNFTPALSAWALLGAEDPNDGDVLNAVSGDARLHNTLSAAALQYTVGDYTAGVQWLQARTTWGRREDDALERWDRRAGQLSFSIIYRFSSQDRTTAPVAAR